MKKLHLKNYLFVLSILFAACSKDSDPTPGGAATGCVITQITYREDDETEVDKIEYDTQLRPIKFGEGEYYQTFTYSENKIVEKEFEDGELDKEINYTLQNNRITRATYVTSETGPSFSSRTENTSDYTYNAEGYLILKKETSVYSSKLNDETTFTVRSTNINTFSYTYVNGNMDTENYSYSYNGNQQENSSTKFTYDTNKANNLPFKGGNFIESFFSGKGNKNAMVKRVYTGPFSVYETTYSYAFDTSGKITSVVETEDGYSETEEYTYICK